RVRPMDHGGSGTQLVVAVPEQAGIWKYGAGRDHGGSAGLCACGVRHVLADPFVEAAGSGNRAALPTRRRDCNRRPVSRSLNSEFLSEDSRAGAARTERKSLVWFEVARCAESI